jgi:hypothetical protein
VWLALDKTGGLALERAADGWSLTLLVHIGLARLSTIW